MVRPTYHIQNNHLFIENLCQLYIIFTCVSCTSDPPCEEVKHSSIDYRFIQNTQMQKHISSITIKNLSLPTSYQDSNKFIFRSLNNNLSDKYFVCEIVAIVQSWHGHIDEFSKMEQTIKLIFNSKFAFFHSHTKVIVK